MTDLTEPPLRVKDVARLLGVTPQTVRNWVNAGRLTAWRHPINGYRLFDTADVERLCHLISGGSTTPSSTRSTAAREQDFTKNSEVCEPKIQSKTYTTDPSDAQDYDWLRQKSKPLTHCADSRLYRIADAFCGGGIFSLGIQEGLRREGLASMHALGIDFNFDAIETFRLNYPEAIAIHGDILNVASGAFGSQPTASEMSFVSSAGKIDILVGGPPCQGHSDLNNHTRRVDPKNELYFSMVRLCELLRPSLVLIENVPGVLHDKGDVVSRTSACLRSLGYHVSHTVIELQKIGVPQKRKRFALVGSLTGRFDFDAALSQGEVGLRSVSWAIDDLLDRYDQSSIFESSANHSQENRRRIRYLFENDVFDLPDSERPPCHRDKAHSYKSVYGRMRWDKPAPTITGGFGSTGQGRFVHPKAERTLTPHEACRLQFVPDFFRFPTSVGRRSMQQIIGNAAPPKLGELVITQAVKQGILE